MDNRIQIIGIGDDGPRGLNERSLGLVREAEVLVGGERHLAMFSEHPAERIVLKNGLVRVADELSRMRESRRIVVLASGDPLFYGIARFITTKVGIDAVNIHPHLSSLQLAFAKLGDSWQDAVLETVHGRPMHGLIQRIDGKPKIAILTDGENNPAAIARYLQHFGFDEYVAFVGENLGSHNERYRFWTLAELTSASFSPLNIVILRRKPDAPAVHRRFGFDDHEFFQRKPDKGLITKKEVRVLSLSEMKLQQDSVVWDIGAGSGSVAIECAKLAPYGQVFAIEKNAADIENIEQNARKFRTDITVIHAKAPDGLEDMPDPDAVFIGGSGGELRELIGICCSRLRQDGRIVINAATIETLAVSQTALREAGYDTRISLMQVARSKPILNMTRFEGLNPIYVITGVRQTKTKMAEESE